MKPSDKPLVHGATKIARVWTVPKDSRDGMNTFPTPSPSGRQSITSPEEDSPSKEVSDSNNLTATNRQGMIKSSPKTTSATSVTRAGPSVADLEAEQIRRVIHGAESMRIIEGYGASRAWLERQSSGGLSLAPSEVRYFIDQYLASGHGEGVPNIAQAAIMWFNHLAPLTASDRRRERS